LLTPLNNQPASYYAVFVDNSTQQVTSGQRGVASTTNFLFRVLHSKTNGIGYYWLVRNSNSYLIKVANIDG